MGPMLKALNATPSAFMTIGEVSRRSGFTIKGALRFYERRGAIGDIVRTSHGKGAPPPGTVTVAAA